MNQYIKIFVILLINKLYVFQNFFKLYVEKVIKYTMPSLAQAAACRMFKLGLFLETNRGLF